MKLRPGDPRGHLATGHEELFAGVRELAKVESQAKDQNKIDGNNGQINRPEGHQAGTS